MSYIYISRRFTQFDSFCNKIETWITTISILSRRRGNVSILKKFNDKCIQFRVVKKIALKDKNFLFYFNFTDFNTNYSKFLLKYRISNRVKKKKVEKLSIYIYTFLLKMAPGPASGFTMFYLLKQFPSWGTGFRS